MNVKLVVECEREEDGRWITKIAGLPGALSYGAKTETLTTVKVFALRVIASRLEHGEFSDVESIVFVVKPS